MKRKVFYTFYIFSIMLGLFALFVLMFFRDEKIDADVEENGIEYDYAEELEQYVSRNFAFRTQAISMFTSFKRNVFASSAVNDVIIGNNGYLYYKDTAADYSGLNQFTDRELYNIKKTLELMEEYVESKGGEFLFAIAPNKNSLYDYMPYNYIKGQDSSNATRLMETLDNVSYVDLFKMFEGKNEELYFKTDTHWNDKGAYYAYEAMQKGLGNEYIDFLSTEYAMEKTHVGDLTNMLYPNSQPTEYRYKFASKNKFKVLTRTRSYEQAYIETYNEQGENSLLMFRDSFANNLIEYMSNTYEYGIYDKNLPYDMTLMDKYESNVVIVSIAERNLKEYLEMAPIMLAPKREVVSGSEEENLCMDIRFEMSEYIKVSGCINSDYGATNADMYLKVGDAMYELTPVTGQATEYGFVGYLEKIDMFAQASIVVSIDGETYEQEVNIEIEE